MLLWPDDRLLDPLILIPITPKCDSNFTTRANFLPIDTQTGSKLRSRRRIREALKLARTEPERRYLTKRLQEVSTGPAPVEAEGA